MFGSRQFRPRDRNVLHLGRVWKCMFPNITFKTRPESTVRRSASRDPETGTWSTWAESGGACPLISHLKLVPSPRFPEQTAETRRQERVPLGPSLESTVRHVPISQQRPGDWNVFHLGRVWRCMSPNITFKSRPESTVRRSASRDPETGTCSTWAESGVDSSPISQQRPGDWNVLHLGRVWRCMSPNITFKSRPESTVRRSASRDPETGTCSTWAESGVDSSPISQQRPGDWNVLHLGRVWRCMSPNITFKSRPESTVRRSASRDPETGTCSTWAESGVHGSPNKRQRPGDRNVFHLGRVWRCMSPNITFKTRPESTVPRTNGRDPETGTCSTWAESGVYGSPNSQQRPGDWNVLHLGRVWRCMSPNITFKSRPESTVPRTASRDPETETCSTWAESGGACPLIQRDTVKATLNAVPVQRTKVTAQITSEARSLRQHRGHVSENLTDA
ncbi:hypothetical protein J6590_031441 [Homalodisca vitripennis]|nr:hypothetical protein J6590_031441 [Homalodisca vitripennis]